MAAAPALLLRHTYYFIHSLDETMLIRSILPAILPSAAILPGRAQKIPALDAELTTF
ncbi:hypothetical protein [Chitinophaga sancti]|uniref:Uncharacterized protein n=1 Tax=Chitinophaga sancti TaxID=1004 RepID=A0ABZ0XAE9_9BACT|nr:hypothetical protein [Chitinophaga sancti]WQG87329.1 hypothetical protein SR876_20610 [Chitinophaga sancti]